MLSLAGSLGRLNTDLVDGAVGAGSASVVWLRLGALCALVGITSVRRRWPSGP